MQCTGLSPSESASSSNFLPGHKGSKWRRKLPGGIKHLLYYMWRRRRRLAYHCVKCYMSFFVFLCLIFSVHSLSTISRRVVTTKQGIIQGVLGPGNVRSSSGSYISSLPNSHWGYGGRPIVEIFKGIPYASPPVDTLRYELPTPLSNAGKNEVYIANISKPPCPTSYSEILERTKFDDPKRALRRTIHLEDCLYLDIYLPYTDKEKGDGLPVLVYANSQPEDSSEPWDGSSVAAIGNIMVIMFRYRVGVLGFVQPGFSEHVGSNFGLWDQIAALQWIKENVNLFGGDPNKITLMGYDLDASLAGILALSPISAAAYGGLFQRLILLNGSPFSPTSINHQPSDTTAHLASALKCPLHERAGELIKCLQYKTPPQLFQAAENMGTPLLTYRFAPSVDGKIIKEDFLGNGGKGTFASDLLGRYDLLCGIREGPTLPRMGQPPWQSLNLEKFVTAVIKLTLRMEPSSEPTEEVKRNLIRAIFKEYGSSPSMKDLVSDFLLVHPVIELLNSHSRTGKNTFFYVFKDYDPLGKNKQSEVPYIFSQDVYNLKYAGSTHTIAELQSFEVLITLLANFVRTGDPTPDRSDRVTNAGNPWPKFTEDMGRYLEIGRDVAVPSHYRESQVKFWSHVFPAVIKPFATSYHDGNFSGYGNIFDFGGTFNQPFDNLNTDHGSGRIRNSGGRNTRFPTDQDDTLMANSSMSQNTVVLIGCLLLLLNTLCFLGLFYQRERLKKAELQLRRRYVESQPSTQNENEPEVPDDESAYVRAPRPIPPAPARDAMSETETENGFGPDFLGPNYDPRTKVSRWMNLQNRVSNSPGLDMNPYPMHNPSLSPPIPMQIHLASIQRLPKPADIIPHMPYQEPFQPAQTFDIPYADSRATSPSIATSTPYNNNLTTNNFNNMNRRSMPVFEPRDTPTPSTTKRGSVVIVRDLDPIDDEMEKMSVKYVPVKTGTLKRSVGVGVAIDEGQNGKDGKNESSSSDETTNGAGNVSKKISFADGL